MKNTVRCLFVLLEHSYTFTLSKHLFLSFLGCRLGLLGRIRFGRSLVIRTVISLVIVPRFLRVLGGTCCTPFLSGISFGGSCFLCLLFLCLVFLLHLLLDGGVLAEPAEEVAHDKGCQAVEEENLSHKPEVNRGNL